MHFLRTLKLFSRVLCGAQSLSRACEADPLGPVVVCVLPGVSFALGRRGERSDPLSVRFRAFLSLPVCGSCCCVTGFVIGVLNFVIAS